MQSTLLKFEVCLEFTPLTSPPLAKAAPPLVDLPTWLSNDTLAIETHSNHMTCNVFLDKLQSIPLKSEVAWILHPEI